jgi:hypothetical protein
MTLRQFLRWQAAIVGAFALIVVAVHATGSSESWVQSLKLSLVFVAVPVFTGFAVLLWLGRLTIDDPAQRFGGRILLPSTFLGWWLAAGLIDDAYDFYTGDFGASNVSLAWLGIGLLWLAASATAARPRTLLPYEYRHPEPDDAFERLDAK